MTLHSLPLPAPGTADAAVDGWATALPDWQDRIRDGRSLVPDLPLDAALADKALTIFKALRVPDIEGHPTYGEVCAPFVFDLVRAIFGAFDQATGARMVREYFLMIPKKNGKTSIAAAIIVTAAILNLRPDAELLLIAPTISVAERSFRQCRGIIRLTRMPTGGALDDLFSIHDHLRTIRNLNPKIPSEIVVKAAEADVITGSKASVILVDETHEFASKPRAAGVFLEIRGGLSHPMNRGFLLQITTQSKVPPAGVFRTELEQARSVRDGALRLPLLPVLYELPPAMAAAEGWRDPATWPLVNPHLGRSVSEAYLADALRKAADEGGRALALLASQHFNVEIGTTLGTDGWPGARWWDGAALPGGLTLEQLLDACDVVTIGVDWGGADDLASLAVIGRARADRAWLHWQHSWARHSVLEARKAIAPALEQFARAGELSIVATPQAQAEAAADVCRRIADSGLLPAQAGIGLDAAGVALLLDALADRGLADPQVVAVGQGWKLQAAVSTLPMKLEAGQLRHGGQGLMQFAVNNARQELRGSNYVVTKAASGAAKIDPLMATFNAAMLMFGNPQPAGASAYVYTGL